MDDSSEGLSDPIPRLEWMGVQRFTAGDHSSAADFFAQARELVLQRLKGQKRSSRKGGVPAADPEAFHSRGRARSEGRSSAVAAAHPLGSKVRPEVERPVGLGSNVGGETDGEGQAGEFHPEAMRLDQCMAVAICRQGPAAF